MARGVRRTHSVFSQNETFSDSTQDTWMHREESRRKTSTDPKEQNWVRGSSSVSRKMSISKFLIKVSFESELNVSHKFKNCKSSIQETFNRESDLSIDTGVKFSLDSSSSISSMTDSFYTGFLFFFCLHHGFHFISLNYLMSYSIVKIFFCSKPKIWTTCRYFRNPRKTTTATTMSNNKWTKSRRKRIMTMKKFRWNNSFWRVENFDLTRSFGG